VAVIVQRVPEKPYHFFVPPEGPGAEPLPLVLKEFSGTSSIFWFAGCGNIITFCPPYSCAFAKEPPVRRFPGKEAQARIPRGAFGLVSPFSVNQTDFARRLSLIRPSSARLFSVSEGYPFQLLRNVPRPTSSSQEVRYKRISVRSRVTFPIVYTPFPWRTQGKS
jgi:hypothetical protein